MGFASKPVRMAIVRAQGLGKTYRVADKQPGLAGTLRHFVNRRERLIAAVQDVSFSIEPGSSSAFLGPTVPARPPLSRCSRG